MSNPFTSELFAMIAHYCDPRTSRTLRQSSRYVKSSISDRDVRLAEMRWRLHHQTPNDCFQWAARAGHKDIVEMLLNMGIQRHLSCVDEELALVNATRRKNPELVGVLLAAGVNVDSRDVDSATPLHIAAHHDDCDMAELLINASATIDAMDDSENTPLNIACAKGNIRIVSMLVEYGADVKTRDCLEMCPLGEHLYKLEIPASWAVWNCGMF